MKKVHIIYRAKVNIPSGVSSVIKMFLLNNECFIKQGVFFKLFSIDVWDKSSTEINLLKSNHFKQKNKNSIKNISRKSYLLSIFLSWRLYDYHAIRVVKKYNRKIKEDPDILMFHDITTAYYYLKKKKLKSWQKSILVIHTNGETNKFVFESFPRLKNRWYGNYLNKRYKCTINRVDKILFVSKSSMANFLTNNKNFTNQKVDYIYNGINDLPSFEYNKIENSNCTFINVSSISTRKGQDLLINCIKNQKEKFENFKFIIVGDGEKRSELEDFSRKNNLEIKFLGIRQDIPQLLQKANIFILPSRDEGLPIAIIEAMRSGLPIIATNVGGISELVDESNGFLIEPNEIELSKVLLKIANNEVDLISFGKKSREKFLENFTVDKMIKKYSEILMEL